MRPPLVKIERAEIMRIREALIEAGLLDKNAPRPAGHTIAHSVFSIISLCIGKRDFRLKRDTSIELSRVDRSTGGQPTSRYEREKRKYHPTACRMISGSNCRHLNKPANRRGQEEHPASLSRATCKVATLPQKENIGRDPHES